MNIIAPTRAEGGLVLGVDIFVVVFTLIVVVNLIFVVLIVVLVVLSKLGCGWWWSKVIYLSDPNSVMFG